jgi:hypothetical protein
MPPTPLQELRCTVFRALHTSAHGNNSASGLGKGISTCNSRPPQLFHNFPLFASVY